MEGPGDCLVLCCMYIFFIRFCFAGILSFVSNITYAAMNYRQIFADRIIKEGTHPVDAVLMVYYVSNLYRMG